jgi:tryptophan-rich sensory protein
LWSPIFFGLHRMRAALVAMAGLWLFVLACVISFGQISLLAGALMVPYLLWVSIAGALNLSVLRRNPAYA